MYKLRSSKPWSIKQKPEEAFVWCFRSHFNEEKKERKKGEKKGRKIRVPSNPPSRGSWIFHFGLPSSDDCDDRSIDHSALATQRPHPAITPSIGVANLFVVMQTSRHKGRIIPASHFTCHVYHTMQHHLRIKYAVPTVSHPSHYLPHTYLIVTSVDSQKRILRGF